MLLLLPKKQHIFTQGRAAALGLAFAQYFRVSFTIQRQKFCNDLVTDNTTEASKLQSYSIASWILPKASHLEAAYRAEGSEVFQLSSPKNSYFLPKHSRFFPFLKKKSVLNPSKSLSIIFRASLRFVQNIIPGRSPPNENNRMQRSLWMVL